MLNQQMLLSRLGRFCDASDYVAKHFLTVERLDQTLSKLAEDGRKAMSAESFAIFSVENDNRTLLSMVADSTLFAQSTTTANKKLMLAVHDGSAGGPGGLTGYLAFMKQPVILSGSQLNYHAQRSGGIPQHLKSGKCVTMLVVPMLNQSNELLGLIKVENIVDQSGATDEHGYFAEADLLIAKLVANQVSIILQSLEIRKENATLWSALDELPLYVYDIDKQKRITNCNDRYCQLYSKTKSELIGKSAQDIHPPPMALKYENDDSRVFEEKKAISHDEFQCRNGKEALVHVIKIPIFHHSVPSQVIGLKGIFWFKSQSDVQLAELVTEVDRQTQKRTQVFEQRLHLANAALNVLDDPILLLESGIIRFINQAAKNILAPIQMSVQQDLTGRSVLEIIPQEYRQNWDQLFACATNAKSPHAIYGELFVRTVHGVKKFKPIIRALSADHDQFLFIISSRETNLAAIDQAELEFLRSMSALTPVLMFVKDRNRKFVYANQALAEHYRASSPEAMRDTLDSDYCSTQEELDRFREHDERILLHGQKQVVIEEEAVTSKSTGITRYYKTIKKPILNPITRELCVLGVSIDIDQSRKISRLLKQTMNTVPESMFLKVPGKGVIIANTAFMDWCSTDENKIESDKRHEWEYSPLQSHRSVLQKMDEEVLTTLKPTSGVMLMIREPRLPSDGGKQPITYREMIKFPIIEDGKVRQILGVCTDRTELKRTVSKLHQAVLSNCLFTHDISAPLRSIREFSNSASLAAAVQFSQDASNSLAAIKDSIHAAYSLRTDLPGIIKSREFHPIELFDFLTVLRRGQVSSYPKQLRIHISDKTSEGRADIQGNRKLLQMAIGKLIENSIQHSATNPDTENIAEVSIAVFDIPHVYRWGIKIQDNGKGYQSDIVSARMFEESSRVGQLGDNLGLGLTITEAIIALHNGDVVFSNGQNNQGAVTTIALPKL
ncbi:MAG: PAS domain-containing protein [Verrucomicrobiaceae bacterium]|jgi:PAS domain S-box-containing protein|nr:PAS domain-containing protein [Verrucomicrobiaceae bacterium]